MRESTLVSTWLGPQHAEQIGPAAVLRPSAGCLVGRAAPLVGPLPTPRDTPSGQDAHAGCGPAIGTSLPPPTQSA